MTRVLLTGGSGFIAAHILDVLLKRGHSVVTTVRSHEKGQKIKAAYPDMRSDQLDYVIVEDIAREGAFAKAVISDPPFQAVIHTASPFHFQVTDVKKDLLDPAVKGTTDILQSIARNAPSVKRVVITSSFSAIVNPYKGSWPEHTYSEEDWNPIKKEQAIENVSNGYRASKTFAERAAWDFVEKEKPNFTIATMCPPQVIGPVIHHLSSLDSLNTSNQIIRDMIQGKTKDKIPPNGTFTWVDVRDLALCHVLAIEKAEASNNRFFVVAGFFNNREIAGILRKQYPEYKGVLPTADTPGGDYPDGGVYKVNNSRVRDVLGVEWRSLEDCIRDTVISLHTVGRVE